MDVAFKSFKISVRFQMIDRPQGDLYNFGLEQDMS